MPVDQRAERSVLRGKTSSHMGSGRVGRNLPSVVVLALFALASLARWLEVDAEEALRSTCRGFRRLFQRLEVTVREQGLELTQMTTAEKLALWEQLKRTPDQE